MESESSKKAKAEAATPLKAQVWNFHNDIAAFYRLKVSQGHPSCHVEGDYTMG